MRKDPLTSWNGLFPYDALASVGVTPESSQTEINAASFSLMEKRLMSPEVRAAWDELRHPHRRLLVDFFLHQTEPDEDFCQALEEYLGTEGEQT